jgi:hypothetical protein
MLLWQSRLAVVGGIFYVFWSQMQHFIRLVIFDDAKR